MSWVGYNLVPHFAFHSDYETKASGVRWVWVLNLSELVSLLVYVNEVKKREIEETKQDSDMAVKTAKVNCFKCVMVGHPSVGKTCFANRVHSGHFIDSPITTFTANSIYTKVHLPSGAIVTLDLWDTAGQERYRSLTLSYFRDTKAVLIMYDAEHKIKVGDWLKEVQNHMTRGEALIFLVGTKLDLGEVVRFEEEGIQALSRIGDNGQEIAGHFALSSKTGANVEDTLKGLAEAIMTAVDEKRLIPARKRETLHPVNGKSAFQSSSKCC